MSLPTPSLLEQGRQALTQQNMPLAIELLGRAVAANPNDADAMALLGMAYSQAGQHAMARGYLEGAAQRQPENVDFRYQLGVALERAGQAKSAIQAYEQAVSLNPFFFQARQRSEALQAANIVPRGGAASPLPRPAQAPTAQPAGPYVHRPAPQYAATGGPGYPPPYGGVDVPDMEPGDAFFRRLGARLIDGFLFVIVIGGAVMLAGLGIAGAAAANPRSEDTAAAGAIGLFILLYVVLPLSFNFYLILMHYARGQTLGQMALGIRVVGADGKKPGLGQLVLRDTIGHWISALFFAIGTFWMLWDPQQQTWADKIASTYVRRA